MATTVATKRPADTGQTKFFMPHVSKLGAEELYQEVRTSLHGQLGLPILDRRIFNLSYTNSKKQWYAEVGQLEEQEGKYEILAIFESREYIVFTRTQQGNPGPIILVDKKEITAIEDFAVYSTVTPH